nr:zinc finger, CCHC-type [Tanacetum cinerariifolium]
DVAFWKEAINDEMDFITGNNTCVLADLPPGCKPLGCKWIFKRKLKVDGTIEKFKARLVIQGFKQKSGIDYFDTYALVARISTIRLLIAMLLIHNLIIHQMDVKIAFLNGDLDEEVYCNPGTQHWHAIQRDEALDKFKVFRTKVELQQGSQIKIFRTDRGAFKPRVNSNWCGISTSIGRSSSSTKLFADLLANLGKHSL